MEVILIRHTSVDVPPGVCYGQTDVPLKPTFEQEAAVTQENLSTMYIPVRLRVAYALPPIAAIRMRNVTNGLWK
jgi:broad specificity phosphatase PhoE